ncbi:MAG: tyrosine-type recombinase/integrase [Nitrosotalea sp.]
MSEFQRIANNDIHNSVRDVERYKNILQKFKNGSDCIKFLDALLLSGRSWIRIATYAYSCQKILQLKDDKPIISWTREDCEEIVKKFVIANISNATKEGHLRTLKRLVHRCKTKKLIQKGREDYCEEVAWITPGSFYDKYEKIQSKDLIKDNEILAMINAVKKMGGKYVKRNILVLFLLLDGSFRPAELLNITIGGIEFGSDFVRVHTTGKTGPKRLTLVTSFVPMKEWIQEHPDAENPRAYLLWEDNEEGRMSYWQLWRLVKRSAQKAGIKKRIWLYLFRHTSITEHVKRLGRVAAVYGNWSPRSKMLQKYTHLADSDQEDAILKLHGLKKEDNTDSILFAKMCPRCHKGNSADKSHCSNCGTILSKKLAQIRESGNMTDVLKFERKFSSEIKNLRKTIEEQQKMFEVLLNKSKN